SSAASRQRGQGAPSSVSRLRITSLSWAWRSASGPGRSTAPASSSSRRTGWGTCSWSKVSTSLPLAKASRSARPRSSPRCTSPTTRAALSAGLAASTRKSTPSAIPAWWVIRASWPPPTIPTTGTVRLVSLTVASPLGSRRWGAAPRKAREPEEVYWPSWSGTERLVRLISTLYRRFAHLIHELAKFGTVGAVAYVTQVAATNLFWYGLGLPELAGQALG